MTPCGPRSAGQAFIAATKPRIVLVGEGPACRRQAMGLSAMIRGAEGPFQASNREGQSYSCDSGLVVEWWWTTLHVPSSSAKMVVIFPVSLITRPSACIVSV